MRLLMLLHIAGVLAKWHCLITDISQAGRILSCTCLSWKQQQ